MAIGALALIAVPASPLCAGLYNTAEAPGVPSRSFSSFREALIPLRQIGAVPSPLNNRCELIATLAARGAPSGLTLEQRLDLGAYLVRLRKYREAVSLLAPAQLQARDNFLVLSNLATAEQLDGQPLRADGYLAEALRVWPKEWTGLGDAQRKWLEQLGWKEKEFRWYREVETYQRKLLKLRLREPASQAGELPANVDGIFADGGNLQFVGPSGHYEAGKLAPAEKAKLPTNAIEIVEQLLLWMPHDNRLYWLLGELFNAEGDVASALAIFKDAAAKWDPKAVTPKGDLSDAVQGGFKRDAALPPLFKEHLAVLRAQPAAEFKVDPGPATSAPPAAVDSQQAAASPPVNWQALVVGFGGGLVFAFLASWQLREIRRRRSRTVP